jgi:broad specificity phosphatase PhoE
VGPMMLLLMRHADKIPDPRDPNLSSAGLLRARELADYIPRTFGAPDFLFASAVSEHSARPKQTLQPLAEKIGVSIDLDFADQDYGALAADLTSDARYAGKRVAIAWHHGNIPPFAHALRAQAGTYPDPWDATVFNLILKFEWTGGEVPAVTQDTEPF